MEKTALGVRLKLKKFYQTKTLTNNVCLNEKLFGFRMTEDKSLDNRLDEFVKIVIDLKKVGVNIEDEDQAIMILNSLIVSNSALVETVKYLKRNFTS